MSASSISTGNSIVTSSRKATGLWGVARKFPIGAFVILLVDASAVVTTVVTGMSFSVHYVLVAVVLTAVFLFVSVCTGATERFRFALGGGRIVQDLFTTCALASALLLPGALSAVVIVSVYVMARNSWRGQELYRWLYTVSSVIMAAAVARQINEMVPGEKVYLLAALGYLVTQASIMGLAFLTCGQAGLLRRFQSRSAWTYNTLTALIAIGLASAVDHHLYYAPAVIPMMFGVQWLATRTQTDEVAAVSPTTGLLTEQAWVAVAEHYLLGPAAWTVVLVMPLNYDQSVDLACVGVLRRSVRVADILGHYDGGFAVLMQSSVPAAKNIAGRIEREMAYCGILVNTSVGAHTGSLSDRLSVALRALLHSS